MPFDAFDVPTVAGEDAFLARFLKGPYPYARVVAGGCETTVVWAEADPPDGLSGAGALPGGEIVHVGLEILDDAALVRRGEVGAGMGEGEGADGGIVRLEDGLEVEREAVPEGELAAGGPCKHTSALWCPLAFRIVRSKKKGHGSDIR